MIDELLRGGTETQLLELINGLDRTKVRPFLCLRDGRAEESRSLEPPDCPLLRLEMRSAWSPLAWAKIWSLTRWLRKWEIDVMQVYFPESTYIGVTAARLAGVRKIVRTRNNLGYWVTPFHRRMGRLCNRYVDVLIANCEACRESVIADEGIAPERVVVLENGVDLSLFPVETNGRSSMSAPSTIRVGVVANLSPVKGLDVFVRAAADVARSFPSATFEIAGDGPMRPQIERLIDEHGLTRQFKLPGRISAIPSFIAGLDVAVLPSFSEGMSNALLEYMAVGRPIVATAVGANPRLITHEVHGLLVPPGDHLALALAMRRLLGNTVLAKQLAANARRRVVEQYSRQAMLRRFEKFYLELGNGAQVSVAGAGARS
jgi:glycosyltransferase involved in cell wall biosynthesis